MFSFIDISDVQDKSRKDICIAKDTLIITWIYHHDIFDLSMSIISMKRSYCSGVPT